MSPELLPEEGETSPDLTTVEQVKELLQDSESADEDLLQQLVTAASEEVTRFAEREFIAADDEIRTHLCKGNIIDLAHNDVRVVRSVTLYTDDPDEDQWVVLEAGDYRLRPIPVRDGVYQWLKLSEAVGPREREFEVQIDGDWGFAEIPKSISYWTAMTVVIWLRSGISAFSTSYNAEEDEVKRPEHLPSAVRWALKGFKHSYATT